MTRFKTCRLAALLFASATFAACSRDPAGPEAGSPATPNRADGPALEDYQEAFVKRVQNVITAIHQSPVPKIDMLDSGCDTSGKQIWHLSRLIEGRMVGISPEDWFPKPEALEYCQGNCSLLRMDGLDLRFPDESFDAVLSANVLEHVSDPDRYLRELSRVLKKGGVAIIEFYPVWTSARGHHIHENMVKDWGGQGYANDGSVIPDWGHLRYSREEMHTVLSPKMRPEVLAQVLEFIYSNDPNFSGINRAPWSKIKSAIEHCFSSVRIKTRPVYFARPALRPSDGKEDYDVANVWVLASKDRDLSALPKSVY